MSNLADGAHFISDCNQCKDCHIMMFWTELEDPTKVHQKPKIRAEFQLRSHRYYRCARCAAIKWSKEIRLVA